ncbi:MAG: exo-beta-N-acetylmuramidase NamZ domain-containing protein [Acidobacteriota bacterium]
MKKLVLLLLVLACTAGFAQKQPAVKTGIDVLIRSGFAPLHGKRVGLITNPTGIAGDLRATIDILAKADGVKLTALYGPEHGVRGDVTAGGHVDTFTDSATGVPVYSLYGKTRKPTPEMLQDVDVLVYDIQDIGARSYTYINTMAYAMEAAAEQNKEFIVLDRPNPLGADRVEGNILDLKFSSFVGQYAIPYVYGMTCGELAEYLNNEGLLSGKVKCTLTVIKMEGYRRSMTWQETGLPWVPTSPHIPHAETALDYSVTGIMGELNSINIGVGYTMPFQLIGAPWIDGRRFAAAMNARNLPGVQFRALSYKPYYGGMKDKALGGVQIYIQDPAKANLVNVQLYAFETLYALYPEHNLFEESRDRNDMFDKVMGTDAVRLALEKKAPAETIIASWKPAIDEFMARRKAYLLYH